MASCPRGDVSSLMKTCRAYYSIGIPTLLRSSNELHKGNQSFYAFMFATSPGPPNRFRYLLDLQVDYDPTNPRSFDVPYLLLRATNLRRLSLHGVDELMECYPHVVDSLTNLVEFRCLDCTEGALEWLQRTSAPISRLQVMFWIGKKYNGVLWHKFESNLSVCVKRT